MVFTISVDEGMIIGVLLLDMVNATAELTRTESNVFAVTVIPTAVGEVEVSFSVASEVAGDRLEWHGAKGRS